MMSTASTGLTFLHQRQCPHHHMPLFHCIHCAHWFDLFATRDNVPTTLYHYSTTSTGLTFFAPKTMFKPPYTTIPLHQVDLIGLTLFAPKTISPVPYATISLCLLCPLHTASTVSTAYCIQCVLHPLHPLKFDLFGWPTTIATTIPLHP